MARIKLSYLVQSRVIYDKNREGQRFPGGKIRWGKWVTWNRDRDNVFNLQDAIKMALARLKARHQGTVVYIRAVANNLPSKKTIPIWEAKWGHDDLPFISWKPNPVADMWRKRLKS